MTNQTEAHAEAILRAAGSSLKHYTMPATRAAILDAVREAMVITPAAVYRAILIANGYPDPGDSAQGMLENSDPETVAYITKIAITLATGDKQP